MRTNYTGEDTERAREFEGTSAGRQTQPLIPAPNAPAPAVQRSAAVLGAAMIALGVLLLLGYAASRVIGLALPMTGALPDRGDIQGGMILLTIGSCFLFFGFWQRIYGLIIPGCILAGLSLGVTFASMSDGASVLWGLSLGFLSILLLGRTLFGIRERWVNWPIFPGVPLFAIGTIIALANAPSFLFGGIVLLPVLLIGLGLYLGWGRSSP